jgi:D-alanine-D-alanine ligase
MPSKRKGTNTVPELPRKVGILYSDVQRADFPTEAQYITEKDAEPDAHLIGEYVQALGIEVRFHPGNAALPQWLAQNQLDMVINLVDSIKGAESLASAIPGALELLGIPYTGAGILGLSLDTNKFLVKKLLQQHGIPVPYFQIFNSAADYLDPMLRFPLISKLNAIHGSVEITADAVSENEKHLRKRLKQLIRTYRQPVLVEEFIAGREFTAMVLQDGRKRVFLAEKVFTGLHGKYAFLAFEDQWSPEVPAIFHYARYRDTVLKEYAKKAFVVTKMAGYGKFDIRLDQSGRYFFIDANCNPALGPTERGADIALILDLYGISFGEIMEKLIRHTAQPSEIRLAWSARV